MFYDNFINYCNNVNKSPSAVASELGLSRASVNGWKHGKIPTDANQIRIANYFGISVSELMSGQKENPTSDNGSGTDDITLDDFTYAFLDESKELTEENKQKSPTCFLIGRGFCYLNLLFCRSRSSACFASFQRSVLPTRYPVMRRMRSNLTSAPTMP